MGNQSNTFGRAYEYACINALKEEISKTCHATIENNNNLLINKEAWTMVDKEQKENYEKSAMAMAIKIIEIEPLMIDCPSSEIVLKFQSDVEGIEGDVRDIIITRDDIQWEIGLSIKHNHFAVKHSRLSRVLDFGSKWFGIDCSENYWNDIKPIFKKLEEAKNNNLKWSELADKANDIYMPLLNAFMDEVKRSNEKDPTVPSKMIEYLLGKYDFYKVISIDSDKVTRINPFNFRGTLNKSGKNNKPKILIPVSALPTRIVAMCIKPESNNTVELFLDSGWQFSFRIHNASTYVETSLKFDVQIVGMPTTIVSINCAW